MFQFKHKPNNYFACAGTCARTCHCEAQVAQRGGGETDDGVDAVDLLPQVHRQRLGRPARQPPQLLPNLLPLKLRRCLRVCHSLFCVRLSALQPGSRASSMQNYGERHGSLHGSLLYQKPGFNLGQRVKESRLYVGAPSQEHHASLA